MEIQPVHSEGEQPWVFFRRKDADAETPVLWPPHEKSWLTGKDSDAGRDWGQEGKGTIEDEMAWWHHWLDGRESEWTLGVSVGQGGLACCDSWGRKESDTTEQLNWIELNARRRWKLRLDYLLIISFLWGPDYHYKRIGRRTECRSQKNHSQFSPIVLCLVGRICVCVCCVGECMHKGRKIMYLCRVWKYPVKLMCLR